MLQRSASPLRLLKAAKKTIKGGAAVNRRQLRTISILATDRCSSRCRHCFIWNKKPNYDLAVEVVDAILRDEVVGRSTYFEITGGEYLEHPQSLEILALLQKSGHDYMLLSNGMFRDKLIRAVRDYSVPRLYMSLDGLGETYKKVRGVDCADDVIRIIDELKDETKISIAYCITPWNALEDLIEVKQLCEEKGVNFFIGAYQNPEFFDTVKEGGKIPPEYDPYLGEFMRLHNSWMDQQVKIPCWSISTKCYVMPNGDVYLCQQKSVVLGNLYEKSLGEIWRSSDTIATHERYRSCNDCWLACNRPFDTDLAAASKTRWSNRTL